MKEKRPFGFNVIAYISGNLGLGVAARSLVELVLAKEFPVAIYDIDPQLGRGRHDMRFEKLCVSKFEDLPYAVDLLVLSAPDVERTMRENSKDFVRRNRLKVAMPFWELPILPPSWVPAYEAVDVVIAASESMRSAFEFTLSGPSVIGGRLPLVLPDTIRPDRKRFSLPDDAVVFVTSFETNSDPERKNPCATIDAFLRGAADLQQAHLLIRINNARTDGTDHPIVAELLQRSAGHARIHLLTEPFAYADVLALYASADVYVSLHRAEGLGLGLMEAMALGKPVIATAWSGNMTFMNRTNGCLVSYRLIPVEGSEFFYRSPFLPQGVQWADPDIGEAAAWMRQLVNDVGLRARIGAAAARDIHAFRMEAERGLMLDELKAIWESRSFLPNRTRQSLRPRRFPDLLAERDQRLAEKDRLLAERERTVAGLRSQLSWLENKPVNRFIRAIRNVVRREPKAS